MAVSLCWCLVAFNQPLGNLWPLGCTYNIGFCHFPSPHDSQENPGDVTTTTTTTTTSSSSSFNTPLDENLFFENYELKSLTLTQNRLVNWCFLISSPGLREKQPARFCAWRRTGIHGLPSCNPALLIPNPTCQIHITLLMQCPMRVLLFSAFTSERLRHWIQLKASQNSSPQHECYSAEL